MNSLEIETQKLLERINSDQESGSSQIAEMALGSLLHLCEKYDASKDHLASTAKKIGRLRPSMPVITNVATVAFDKLIELESPPAKIIRDLQSDFRKARDKTIIKAVDRIIDYFGEEFAIGTCSYSSTVLNVIRNINEQSSVRINILKSEFGGISYGENLRNSLKEYFIESDIYADNDSIGLIENSDLILIGADSLPQFGGVINGVPSFHLASQARGIIDFYVCAESFKKAHEIDLEDGFDFIPAEMIKEIFSDNLF